MADRQDRSEVRKPYNQYDAYREGDTSSAALQQQRGSSTSSYPPPPPPPRVGTSATHQGEYEVEARRDGATASGEEYDNSEEHDETGLHRHKNPKKRSRSTASPSGTINRKPRLSTDTNTDVNSQEQRTVTPPSTSGDRGHGQGDGPRRAAQACLRCRKQKLKCIGGWPCNRCTKSKHVCDFGTRPDGGYGGPSNRDGDSNARLEQLESSVANLLAGLSRSGAGAGAAGGYSDNGLFDSVRRKGSDGFDPKLVAPFQSQQSASWTTDISAPRRSLDSTAMRLPFQGAPALAMSPDDLERQTAPHVRFTSSPNATFILPQVHSPSAFSSNGTGPSPASGGVGRSDSIRSDERRHMGKGQKAEERLATATEGDFDEAPFKALVYQPAVWDNREQSRRSSPLLSQPQSRDEPLPGTYDKRVMRDRDDPVNTNLVDIHMAHTLFDFFVDHCHPFLPVVNVALDDAFNTIRQSPFLISAIVAVAARFYIRFTSRSSPGAHSPLDPSIPARLVNLAEAHLGNTLLRKQHALSDVQAVLLLAAWGLQSGGRGPDAWVVTGHAARIARRLGVQKVLGQAAEMAKVTKPGTEGWDKLDAFMPQWRTWLCWFCFDGFLSLGFGRPQSTQFETTDEQSFLQIRINQTLPRPGSTSSISLYGDVYIAGQVQLTQIGRDLVNWGEMLADPKSALWADRRRADMFQDKELSVKSMFKDLNARLDEWSKLWVWSGSPYTLYLGSSARIARLQADHMRLCLNSFALKSGPDEDPYVAQCLKKALNAAMSTIQTHYESSQTDMALSFATDYLTITLAQAAVFLVRMTKASPTTQRTSNIDPSVIAHYLKMSIDLLEVGEMSETRLSTYLAKTIRDIARAADILGLGPPSGEGNDETGQGQGQGQSRPSSSHDNTTTTQFDSQNQPDLSSFDMDSFLQFESQLDLGYLLGLPGDNSALFSGLGLGLGGTMTPISNSLGTTNTSTLISGLGVDTGGFEGASFVGPGQGSGSGSGTFNGLSSEFSYGMSGIGSVFGGMGMVNGNGSNWGYASEPTGSGPGPDDSGTS
ncbi:hypothetical protein CI109_100633 [Kwoniella shandongensis]|uniref:Uncharacterized protein n=1 Tax=Kwoniella shandongensis TaxID=1734106 RepID=A0A5M6BZ73_9TREE|nr:uncharacterized protein CI109_003445 [Kwoniella shandongensis]KAA5528157.1 hypothetical protein CI109_003445 [Kwoniella shandongensis]